MPSFTCVRCSHETTSEDLDVKCSRCGSAVVLQETSSPDVRREDFDSIQPGVWRFRAFLPQVPPERTVTLGEGGTPLLPAARLGKELGLRNLKIKDETRNPTGSFIDRGSTVLVSLAKLLGVRTCACETTGNLGASMAAYCAKAAIAANIEVHPSADRGKLYQMLAYGANVEARRRHSRPAGDGRNRLTVTAGNPYLLEGEKTTSFEIAQDLGWEAPDIVVVPVGTGGHLSMIWKGMKQLISSGLLTSPCRILGVQVGESDVGPRQPLGRTGVRGDGWPFTELEESEPFFMEEARKAIEASHGRWLTTASKEVIRATSLLARTEGIFAEPASASVVASLQRAVELGYIDKDEVTVCVVTGAGLKDTKAVARLARETKKALLQEGVGVVSMKVGDTKLAMLRLLQQRPRYGYELWQELSVGGGISTASVYQHLAELESLVLIRRMGASRASGRERILYEPTSRGLEFLKAARGLSVPDMGAGPTA